MVKFSNKGKGKSSKRTTFKIKYKIERKVKQYRKKLKKHAKKLKNNGIKHRKNVDQDNLPNLFPFKNQMLQQFKNSLPKEAEVPIERLNSADFGLITIQNKSMYQLKNRDNLTKKYLTNVECIFKRTRIVLEVLDSRNPEICIDETFRTLCQKSCISTISVLTKIDTVPQQKVVEAQQKLAAKKQTVARFTQDSKQKKELIEHLIKTIQIVKTQLGIKDDSSVSVFVAGKENTGKHTLISLLCKYAGKYQQIPSELFELVLAPGIKIIDAPYKLEDKTNFPLFTSPSELRFPDLSLISQQQTIIKHLFFGGLQSYKSSVLSRNKILEYYMIQDYTSVEDLCKKVGKSLRIFGKGGMVDMAKVRNKILSEWFQGKLNQFMNPPNQ